MGARSASAAVSKPPWAFDFTADGSSALSAEYDLPPGLERPRQALGNFFDPVADHVRSGPTGLLDASSLESLRNAARTLKFLDDLKQKTLELVDEKRVMDAVVLATTSWRVVLSGPVETELLRICARRSLADRAAPLALALTALGAGLMGPLALLPGTLLANEVMIRRGN